MDLSWLFNFKSEIQQSSDFIKEKNYQEIDFWEKRFSEKGGRKYWQNLYVSLYKYYLQIDKYSLKNKRVLDIGCGPHGAIRHLGAELMFGLDPLVEEYNKRFHLENDNVIYLNSGSENIPILSNYFDVVISRNALDHVDDIKSTIEEVWRVLKPNGEIRFSINYQPKPTPTEPVVINDGKIKNLFNKFFKYKILKRFKPKHDSLIGGRGMFRYPHEIILLQGYKKNGL